MGTRAAQPLDYATSAAQTYRRPALRSLLALSAIGGIVANLAFITLLTIQLHRSSWVDHELRQNPRAYGREIDPITIASLSDRRTLYAAFAAFALASAFGCLLAVNLLVSMVLVGKRYDSVIHRLAEYRRWKPLGVLLTAAAFFWAFTANFNYWVEATAHFPIGSGPPIIETALLLLCGMLPWSWVGKSFDLHHRRE